MVQAQISVHACSVLSSMSKGNLYVYISLSLDGFPRPAKGCNLGLQSWSKGTPFDWTPQIKEKPVKAIRFIVNLPESCVFIYIFDIFDPESPKSCVFMDIFDIFDIWRSLCNLVSRPPKGPSQAKARKTNTFHSQPARKLCFHAPF